MSGGGGVRGPAVDGGGVTGDCDPGVGQSFTLLDWGAGQMVDVEVRGNRCGGGIRAFAGSTAADIGGATVSGIRQGDSAVGITLGGTGTASVANSTIRDADWGIFISDHVDALIEDNTLEDLIIGVAVSGPPGVQATVTNNAIGDVLLGVAVFDTGIIDVTGNTIVGKGTGVDSTVGIDFGPGGSGSASGNAISNFDDGDDQGTTSCGIHIAADAGAVTIGDNVFPAPGSADANEQDVCHDQP